jgi:probable rRNA maturation factor
MSALLTVSNRQKSSLVKLSGLEPKFEKLRRAVFQNLSQKRPKHLKASQIKALASRGCISVVLVSDKQIKKLNKEWRHKDYATDVLSFPMELTAPAFAEIPWQLGEIVISVERALKQSEEYGHSFQREMAFLFVHGLLHVLGFDHEELKEEKEMFGRQRAVLDSLGIKR